MLGEPGNSRAFRVDLELSTEQAFALTREELRSEKPVIARWSMGARQPVDVIWTGIAAPVLISDRVVTLLSRARARGWNAYEVALHGKGGEAIGGYHGLSVHGRCGEIDNSRSVEVPKVYPAGVFPVWRGLYFDPRTWDGSDVFMSLGGEGWIFVVEGVKQALEKAKVKNVVFKPLDAIERSAVQMGLSAKASPETS